MKNLLKGAVLIASLSLAPLNEAFAQEASEFLPGTVRPEAEKAVKDISDWLKVFQDGIKKKFGVDEVYIGGGSSRAILDAIYQNSMPDMRDLDIFIVLNKEVTFENSKEIGQTLESTDLGRFAENDLRPRPRSNPKLLPDMKAALSHNAGYGFFWLKDKNIFDLSVYHSRADLALNGILNFDMVMIPLRDQTLESWFVKNKNKSVEQLLKNNRIIDEHGGYVDWLKKDGKLINHLNVEADPFVISIRLTRSFAKIGRIGLPEGLAKDLTQALNRQPKNRLQIVRNLEKMLEDKVAYSELKTLQSIGFFKIYPELDQVISNFKQAELKEYLAKFIAEKTTQKPLIAALYETLSAKSKLELAKDIELVHPKWAQHEIKVQTDIVSGKQRVGIFTGVFNPMHLGHIEVIKNALKAAQLDLIYVIPTPATTHNEKPIEWQHRLEIAKLSTKNIPQVRVIDPSYLESLNISTGAAMEKLKADLGDKTYVQVMGLDSFERYNKAGRYDKDSKNEIIVMSRGDGKLPLAEAEMGSNIIYFDKQKTANFAEENRSSTQIRDRLAKGESIISLVSKEVENYIHKNRLYRPAGALMCNSIF